MNFCQKKEKFRTFMKCFIKAIEIRSIGICSERPKKIITRDWSYHFCYHGKKLEAAFFTIRYKF